jgi:acetyl-CoA C-acetyltransferase
MTKRVAICAVAQIPYEREKSTVRFQGMASAVLKQLLEQTGLDFDEEKGIKAAITCSDDVFDARTISDNAMTDAVGAHYRSEEKVAADGAQAVYYALANVLSGHYDVVSVIGHSKESQGQSRNLVTHLAFEPFFTRPVGMDFVVAAALQAQAYMAKSGLTDAQMAELVVRARDGARKNPYQQALPSVTEGEVLASPLVADPLRALHAYPVTDGAVGLIVASEEVARRVTDKPVWITGAGNCLDTFFLGERDLAGNFALAKAAGRAYAMAGVKDAGAFDVAEISDPYAYMLPLWAEGLGLCGDGRGAKWLADGGPDARHVNLTGGTLAGVPQMLGGLARVAEAARHLRGEAGAAQVKGATRAVAHGLTGPAGQLQTVVVLEA